MSRDEIKQLIPQLRQMGLTEQEIGQIVLAAIKRGK